MFSQHTFEQRKRAQASCYQIQIGNRMALPDHNRTPNSTRYPAVFAPGSFVIVAGSPVETLKWIGSDPWRPDANPSALTATHRTGSK